MKKYILQFLKSILFIICLPVTAPVYMTYLFILFITKGRRLTANDINMYIQYMYSELKHDMQDFLDIHHFPPIDVTYDDAAISKTILARFVQFGKFQFNFNFNCKRLIVGNDVYNTCIILYPQNIYSRMHDHNLLTKIKIVNSLIHEMTHYRQSAIGLDVNTTGMAFEEYHNSPIEKQARRAAKLFVIAHLGKIIKIARRKV